MNNISDVVKWLTDLGHLEATPVQVTLNKEKYDGVSYINHADLTRVIYIAGRTLPKEYKRSTSVCYDDSTGQEWYVSGYIEFIKPEHREYHPFGPNFMLRIWPKEFKSIDYGLNHKYKHYPFAVEVVGDKRECPPPVKE